MLELLLEMLESRERREEKSREDHAASCSASVGFLLSRLTGSICVQLSFKYAFPVLFQTKINAKSLTIVHGKRELGDARFLTVVSCLVVSAARSAAAAPGPGAGWRERRRSRSRITQSGLVAGWAVVRRKELQCQMRLQGFFSERGQMKFSRCTRQHCNVSVTFQVK